MTLPPLHYPRYSAHDAAIDTRLDSECAADERDQPKPSRAEIWVKIVVHLVGLASLFSAPSVGALLAQLGYPLK